MTPRLFEALVGAPDTTIAASVATYVPAISQHMQSVAPSKQVMAQYWCPVVVEDDIGARRVLHVDPLAVRKFRRSVAEELRCVQDKRRRMMQRIKSIRQDLPPARVKDVSARLGREITEAEEKASEPLLQSLPSGTQCLHVFLEATQHMMQLSLVCEHLMRELPAVMEEAGVHRVSLAILGGINKHDPPPLEGATAAEACAWLSALNAAYQSRPLPGRRKTISCKGANHAGNFNCASALQRAATAETLGKFGDSSGDSIVLLVVCSPPSDLDECVATMRRSDLVLQVVGVFGVSPDDPEPALQKLTDASAPNSSLHLFFGREYWTKFATVRRRQLNRLRLQRERHSTVVASADVDVGANEQASLDHDSEDSDVVSPKVFEMRLIERIMWECYMEEQRCEEELACAGKVLERTLVDREDILATMRAPAKETSARTSSAPPPRHSSPPASPHL